MSKQKKKPNNELKLYHLAAIPKAARSKEQRNLNPELPGIWESSLKKCFLHFPNCINIIIGNHKRVLSLDSCLGFVFSCIQACSHRFAYVPAGQNPRIMLVPSFVKHGFYCPSSLWPFHLFPFYLLTFFYLPSCFVFRLLPTSCVGFTCYSSQLL